MAGLCVLQCAHLITATDDRVLANIVLVTRADCIVYVSEPLSDDLLARPMELKDVAELVGGCACSSSLLSNLR